VNTNSQNTSHSRNTNFVVISFLYKCSNSNQILPNNRHDYSYLIKYFKWPFCTALTNILPRLQSTDTNNKKHFIWCNKANSKVQTHVQSNSSELYMPSKVELKGVIWQNTLSTCAHTYHSCGNDFQVTITTSQYGTLGTPANFSIVPRPWLEERCAGFMKDIYLQCLKYTAKILLQDRKSRMECSRNAGCATNFCCLYKLASNRIAHNRDPKHCLHHNKHPSKADIVQAGTTVLQIFLTLITSSSFRSFYIFERLHLFDLLYEICLLVVELFVFRPVRMEPRQKLNKLLAVPKEYFLNRTWLVWVCYEHLHNDKQQSKYITNYVSSGTLHSTN